MKMRKPLRRAQAAKKEAAQACGTRVGCAARVCTFLFEILRVNRVLSAQIAALGATARISAHVLAISRERN